MATPEEKQVLKQMVQDAGREAAEHWMRSAIEGAENDYQMNNQIEMLKAASISILAHYALNAKVQCGVDYADSIQELRVELVQEFDLLENSLEPGEWIENKHGAGDA